MENGLKKEEFWVIVKDAILDVDLKSMREELIDPINEKRRNQLSESDVDDKMVELELELINSILLEKWSEISKLGSDIVEIT